MALNVLLSQSNFKEHSLYQTFLFSLPDLGFADEDEYHELSNYELSNYEQYETFLTWLEDN